LATLYTQLAKTEGNLSHFAVSTQNRATKNKARKLIALYADLNRSAMQLNFG